MYFYFYFYFFVYSTKYYAICTCFSSLPLYARFHTFYSAAATVVVFFFRTYEAHGTDLRIYIQFLLNLFGIMRLTSFSRLYNGKHFRYLPFEMVTWQIQLMRTTLRRLRVVLYRIVVWYCYHIIRVEAHKYLSWTSQI